MSDKANSLTSTDVLVAVDDLFFFAKIEAAANAAGTGLLQASEPDRLQVLLARLTPRLIILDLNSRVFDSLHAARSIRSDTRFAKTRVIGFYSHVDVELRRAAEKAGCDLVLPRSAFVTRLRELLK